MHLFFRPKYGGKYCLGERRRYRTCNRDPCPADQTSFRHIQCSRFNTIPYKGKFYKWIHVNNRGAHYGTICADMCRERMKVFMLQHSLNRFLRWDMFVSFQLIRVSCTVDL